MNEEKLMNAFNKVNNLINEISIIENFTDEEYDYFMSFLRNNL